MKRPIKYTIFRWIKIHIFKSDDSTAGPLKFIWLYKAIYFLFFPLRFIYERQTNFHYDWLSNTYTIEGNRFTANELRELAANRNRKDFSLQNKFFVSYNENSVGV